MLRISRSDLISARVDHALWVIVVSAVAPGSTYRWTLYKNGELVRQGEAQCGRCPEVSDDHREIVRRLAQASRLAHPELPAYSLILRPLSDRLDVLVEHEDGLHGVQLTPSDAEQLQEGITEWLSNHHTNESTELGSSEFLSSSAR